MQITAQTIEQAMATLRQQRDAAEANYHRNCGALVFAEKLLQFLAQPEEKPAEPEVPVVRSADNVTELNPAAE